MEQSKARLIIFHLEEFHKHPQVKTSVFNRLQFKSQISLNLLFKIVEVLRFLMLIKFIRRLILVQRIWKLNELERIKISR